MFVRIQLLAIRVARLIKRSSTDCISTESTIRIFFILLYGWLLRRRADRGCQTSRHDFFHDLICLFSLPFLSCRSRIFEVFVPGCCRTSPIVGLRAQMLHHILQHIKVVLVPVRSALWRILFLFITSGLLKRRRILLWSSRGLLLKDGYNWGKFTWQYACYWQSAWLWWRLLDDLPWCNRLRLGTRLDIYRRLEFFNLLFL